MFVSDAYKSNSLHNSPDTDTYFPGFFQQNLWNTAACKADKNILWNMKKSWNGVNPNL